LHATPSAILKKTITYFGLILNAISTLLRIKKRLLKEELATPIVNCLENHFQNDVLLFINKHSRNGLLPHSKFRKVYPEKGNS
jgi:hypothetical protein